MTTDITAEQHPVPPDAAGAAEVAAHEPHAAHENHNLIYLKVAAVLAVLTALETATYWVDLGGFHTPFLLIMMVAKFALVILFFMHLKYDNKWFGALFYMGLAITIPVYLGVMLTFRFFQ